MKKYKALSRIFLLSYLVAIFCAVLFGGLLTKYSVPVALVFIALAAVDLGFLIAARALFAKHYKLFFYFSIGAIGYLNIAVLGAFILEAIFTAQGQSAPYAWMISIISIVFMTVIDIFYVLSLKKIHHKKMVELGLEEEEAEEEI